MGLLDKLMGREKKAPDDMAGDTSLPHEGMQEGMADDGAAPAEGHGQEAAEHQPEHEN